MKRFLLISAAAVSLLIATGVAAFILYTGSDIPAAPLEALRHAESYELVSLEPEEPSPPTPDLFHNWTVLGRTLVADQDTRDQLTTALRRSARKNYGEVAGCFWPRHGIRVVHQGRTFEFVICFECLQAQVFLNGEPYAGFLVTESAQPVFDDVLRKAKVPLAKPH